jgi:hypothetical protein
MMNLTSLRDHPAFCELASMAPRGVSTDLGSISEPILDHCEVARAAWKRLRAHQCWQDWRPVCLCLAEGSAVAMKAAHTNERKGRRYNEEYGAWLKAEGFTDIPKTTRYNALKCADLLDTIETFLANLKLEKRLRLNHPASVLAAWKKANTPPADNINDTSADSIEHTKDKGLDPVPFLSATQEQRNAFAAKIGFTLWVEATPSFESGGKPQTINNAHAGAIVNSLKYALGRLELGNELESIRGLRGIVRILEGQGRSYHDLIYAIGKKLVGPDWDRK